MNRQDRFDYSFAAICFALLSLSVHFAPTYGRLAPELLVASWSLLLTAALVTGWRIGRRLHGAPGRGECWLQRAQIAAFVAGLVCAQVFVSINYLRGAEPEDDSFEARRSSDYSGRARDK